jgi:aldehyde:ferredoxin oxidoreductase
VSAVGNPDLHGWCGRSLNVDLYRGSSEVSPVLAETLRTYIGGRGLGAYMMLESRVYEKDPLGPDNPIVIANGPITGMKAPTAGRFSASTRSPLTGALLDCNCGGPFGIALKRKGWDCLRVDGCCAEPSYLLVDGALDDARADVLPAKDLWGLDVPSSLGRLAEMHPGCQALVIGPAGENGVLFATAVTNRGRSLGRGGFGTVMGAKKLKAIVITGDDAHKPAPADADGFDFVVYEAQKMLKASPITSRGLPEFGTSVLVNVLNQAGALPTRNYRESQFELAESICGETLRRDFVTGHSACTLCPIGCTRKSRTAHGSGHGPEYETVWAFGADCGVGDLDAIIEASYACNRLGLDTITMGATIACAMELTEEGCITDGPRFGDGQGFVDLIEATANVQGLGSDLALGSRRLAERYLRPELSMTVKSLELPAYDPRGIKGQGLAYATSNRGGCHLRANMTGPEVLGVPKMIDRFATLGKAGLLINLQDLNAVLDSLVVCKFAAFAVGEGYWARMLSAATGERFEPQDLMRVGERIWNLERLFNNAAGFTREDDSLPPRLVNEPVREGPSQGHTVDLQPMLDEYYTSRGWTRDGQPRRRKLEDLGLVALADKASAAAT